MDKLILKGHNYFCSFAYIDKIMFHFLQRSEGINEGHVH